MATHTLKITFAGICAHFRDLVPGVPHRIVLPDASDLHLGAIRVGPEGDVFNYVVMPHFAFLQASTREGQKQLTLSEILDEGVFLTGARMQVLNAEGNDVDYDLLYGETPQIVEFVPRYDYSQDVVFGGRAALYFDIFSGFVSSFVTIGGARHVTIEMQTDGPPKFLVTPLDTADTSTRSGVITLEDDALTVANMEIDETADPSLDFVLHYLTAQRGLPQILEKETPGMKPNTPGLRPEDVAVRLASRMTRGRPTPEEVWGATPEELTPSCSDSRYP